MSIPVSWLFDSARQGSTVTVIDPVASWLPDGFTYNAERDLFLDDNGDALAVDDLSVYWTTTLLPVVPDARGGTSEMMIETGEVEKGTFSFYITLDQMVTIRACFAVIVQDEICKVTEISQQPVGAPQWARIQVQVL